MLGAKIASSISGFLIPILKEIPFMGAATEAVRAALDYAFRVLGLRRVKLRTFAHNLRARRAFQKAGFREVGVVPGPRGREDVHMEVRREDLGPEA